MWIEVLYITMPAEAISPSERYFLPTVVAVARKVTHQGSVIVIDLFPGWTFVGWVIALDAAADGCSLTRLNKAIKDDGTLTNAVGRCGL